MPYKMTWLIDKRVLHIVIEGELSGDTIREMVAESRKMTDDGIKPVHAIADATHTHSIPKHIPTILKEYGGVTPQDTGFTVIIATSPVTRFLAQALLRLLRLEIRFGSDIQDALNILHRVDTTLPIESVVHME
ncbi:MAG TPA: hypothetical protein PLZ51_14150 [Aggregatilineales bacterium]|nr:hypothetical protein [Aggregatilineales bacterium]